MPIYASFPHPSASGRTSEAPACFRLDLATSDGGSDSFARGLVQPAMNRQDDVLVVGGGPAGLAAAIALQKKGFRVTVVDGAPAPIEKVCGEGILPEGVAALRQLGVEVPARNSHRFQGLRFFAGPLSAEARFPSAYGLGIRRITLQKSMMEAAEQADVALCWASPVTGLDADGTVYFNGRSHRPRWVVAADGGYSRMRRWAGLESRPLRGKRFAFRRHYQIAPWSDFVEVYWGKSCQLYVTPLSATEAGVVLLSNSPALRIDEALHQFPVLSERLRSARILPPERGGITGRWIPRRVVRGNVILLGDAAGMVDAITGEGLRLGFQQALILADALAAENLAAYQRRQRRLLSRPRLMARLMLAMQNSPSLQRRVIRVLSHEPALFRRILSVHAGSASPVHLASVGARFGWRLLAREF